MGLVRLRDTPIIGGTSTDLRALHPDANPGPVLTLPVGWEPCWTFAEIVSQPSHPSEAPGDFSVRPGHLLPAAEAAELATELHAAGWIVYSAKTDQSDWDLYRMRPDGSNRQALVETAAFSEAGPRMSPDGKRLLYYRLPKGEPVNMNYGTRDLIIADADGRNPVFYGRQFPWASWGPDSDRIACLKPAGVKPPGIQIVDVSTRTVLRQLPDQHITQQLVWSPDGQWFLGTANRLGEYWNIGRLSLETGEINVVSETDRFNCTPDWTPDSQEVVYARGINPTTAKDGRAEMWLASGDGKEKQMLFAEEGRHIYGACVSPDGKYCLFTRSKDDFGHDGDVRGFTMAIMRRTDAPMIGESSESLRKRFPNAKSGPWLDLGSGWEPHWTAVDASASQKAKHD
jgi:Tol biopolymer transport system component